MLAGCLLSTLSVAAPVARAESVQSAQAKVDSLQSLARDTTAKLTVGTARWERDQRRLRQYSLALANTRRSIVDQQSEVARLQLEVSSIARQLYITSGTGTLHLAFTSGREEFLQAMRVQQALEQASGGQARVIARAETARLRLRTQEQAAQQLVQDAAALAKASAKRLAELTALADRTSQQLTSAQNNLERALTARAKAARDRAAANARAARSRVAFSGGAACTGKSTAGQANGNLDPSSLCPLWMAPGHRLRSDAAKAFNAMSQYYAKTQGPPLCVTDSYRSYSEQASLYRRKPGLAAVPGSSNHGWGVAVDFCGGVQNSGSAAYQWMKANAGTFGWIHPDWAEPSGSRPEAWHWEYTG